jgi:hypothetical protein
MAKNRFPMPTVDPLTREALANWILGTVEKYVRQAEKLEQKLQEDGLNRYETGQLNYYRWTAGYASWLAHLVRKFPLRDLEKG